MSDQNQLYEGLSNTAWGYFFLFINFDLNIDSISVNILPPFVGCLLLLSAIKKLTPERRDLALLRPLCILLAAWHAASWALALVGIKLGEMRLVFLDLLVLAATLYFHFQYLTDVAALAERYQSEEEHLDKDIRGCRTDLILLLTASNAAGYLVQFQPFQEGVGGAMTAALAICLTVATLILIVLLMMALFRLRRDVRDRPDIGPE